jgi:hypothetical protein
MYTGPKNVELSLEQEIDIKASIYKNLSYLLNCQREEGTCKKMIRLSHLKPEWAELAVVFGHHADAKHKQIIQDERKYLAHLQENNYPVVQVIGKEFAIEHNQSTDHDRFGMLMRYIPGVFIEAKTFPPLKIYIIAALLGIEYIRPQEAWLALNKSRLLQDIEGKIKDPFDFAKLQAGAKILEDNFAALISKFEEDQAMVVDLQMIISSDGTLTIIDPLDVLKHNKEQYLSILPDAPKPSDDLLRFVQNTKIWLKSARQTCNRISSATHYSDLTSLLNLDVEPLVFSSRSDPRGHSRISQIKSQSQTPSSNRTLNKLLF